MSKINRLVPFSWWPANWGLAGDRRAEAEAQYYWDGEDLDYRLLEIRQPSMDAMAWRAAKLHLDYRYHKVGEFDYGLGLIANDVTMNDEERGRASARYLRRFGKITEEDLEYQLFDYSNLVKGSEEYQRERLKLDVKFGKKTEEQADHELLDQKFEDKSSIDYQIAQQALELKWGNITQNQHDKEVATLLREPWFNILGAEHKVRGDNTQMAIEMDWNEFFIQFLEEQGWTGISPDDIVDRWFDSTMRRMLDLEEADGEEDPLPMAGARPAREDGLTEYR